MSAYRISGSASSFISTLSNELGLVISIVRGNMSVSYIVYCGICVSVLKELNNILDEPYMVRGLFSLGIEMLTAPLG